MSTIFEDMEEDAKALALIHLRDQFAMAALQGLLAGGYQGEYSNAARHAYYYADEMLEARDK